MVDVQGSASSRGMVMKLRTVRTRELKLILTKIGHESGEVARRKKKELA